MVNPQSIEETSEIRSAFDLKSPLFLPSMIRLHTLYVVYKKDCRSP